MSEATDIDRLEVSPVASNDSSPFAAEETVEVDEATQIPKHFTAPALIQIDRIDDDRSFMIRSALGVEDIAPLATDIARLGQLFPIDVRSRPPDRFQIITGFRRVAALRFLQRDRVLVRLHTDLSDNDALLMALAAAMHARAVSLDELKAVSERFAAEGRLSAAARDMIDKALTADDELSPEMVGGEEEVDADELASDVTIRLGQCNADLSMLADVFSDLDETRRAELMNQLRYSAQLVAFLEGQS